MRELKFGATLPDQGRFDVVVAADVLYDNQPQERKLSAAAALFRTVDALLSRAPDALFLLSYMHRSADTAKSIQAEAEARGFACEEARREHVRDPAVAVEDADTPPMRRRSAAQGTACSVFLFRRAARAGAT